MTTKRTTMPQERISGENSAAIPMQDDTGLSGDSDAPSSITVVLPLPPIELSKNGRAHWAVRARLYRQHREWGWLAVMAAVADIAQSRPWDGPVTVRADWYWQRGSAPDTDNAIERLAAYMDGAQDAGLFANDKQIAFQWVRTEHVKHDPHVSLTFKHGEEQQ